MDGTLSKAVKMSVVWDFRPARSVTDLTTFLGVAASGLWNLVGTPRVLTRFSILASGESRNIWRFHGKTGSRGTNLFWGQN